MSPVSRATTIAAAWGAALGLLAFEWTRTPLSGPGPAFLIWMLPAVPLAALTWVWLRDLDLGRARLGAGVVALVVVVWAAVAALTASGLGAEWELDGLILRNAPQRAAGEAVRWLPGVWGALVSVAGLALALEARYWLTHPRTPGAAAAHGAAAPVGAPDGRPIATAPPDSPARPPTP